MVRKAPQSERQYGGVYAAVAEAIEAEVGMFSTYTRAGRHIPPVFEEWRARGVLGATLEVPAYLLPRPSRLRLEPGRPMFVAVVSADDRVSFRAETTVETVERLGL
ncbi:hypothetical protein MMAN_04520 [Mycobacterium mantenii]|uniref:Uncharacterized protein n=1 Tax=Mycobacterium mantenii TaxID=560555 RepID=A0A1X0F535_MYCNT|nr:hypothetical protein [Mycobacterium mantenii]MCV7241182.1 hypothetical protein [Mycobacterium mantenii]ORA96936.1 hypothetical protein BST30_28090 [Mycobacterium mantenii]BBY36318.1 hypothetical protein MMAN_04520 [Mycobacterium mantenii]